MTAITDEDRKAIADAPDLMLAEWWCLLNGWSWPRDGLGRPDPITGGYQSDSRRSQIMAAICERIGMRECLREWNREILPGEAFDKWWNSGCDPMSVRTA